MGDMAGAGSNRRLRTGLFDIDLSCPELRKEGLRVPLQEQPFRVLSLLLERPGKVVTREELQTKLWPGDTYVGFDEGINTAIRKLRLAFGDSADNPRFIETLPRRGYRFIAPVSETASTARDSEQISGGNGGHGPAAKAEIETGVVGPTATAVQTPALPSTSPRSWKLVASAAVFLLLLATGTYLVRRRPSASPVPPKRMMLAVLPFQNLSGNPSQEYFSDGLTEETITDLGQLSPEHLGVIARTSAMAYKHTDKTVSQIGRELGVDYILEGSIRREGGKVRVSAQLIRVSDQTHMWAQNYERELHDLLEIENELGRAIAQQVQANLSPQRQDALAKLRPVDPDAYDLYLKGRYYWNQRTPASIKQSIAYFQEATARDPNFAQAYAGLADAYNISSIVGLYSSKQSLPQAEAAAKKAIELDPSLAEAHAALGMEKSHYDFDFPGAEKEFLKALELNPNSAYAHLFYSNCYLMPMGRAAEAIAENEKAVALDPLSLPINNFLGMSYLFGGDYEKSHRQFQRTMEIDPAFELAHAYFAFLLTEMGRFEEAIGEAQKAELLMGVKPERAAAEAASLHQAFRTGGEKGFWQRRLEIALQELKRREEPPFAGGIAESYARTGDPDRAFEWLDKAYEEREGGYITMLKVEPGWKNLRGDARFAAFQRRMGLPE